MNKFKNKKDLKKIILKLKLKLDSSDENSINDVSSQLRASQTVGDQDKDQDVSSPKVFINHSCHKF
jgi:hypothetical protein